VHHIKRLERVVTTVQILQTPVFLLTSSEVSWFAVAEQLCQHGIFAYIKRGELVTVAEQIRQLGVVAYIKRNELVAGQYSSLQRDVGGYIKRG